MAFNGSKGIPEGEMIKLLEREGLAFGADTNASTGFDAILTCLTCLAMTRLCWGPR